MPRFSASRIARLFTAIGVAFAAIVVISAQNLGVVSASAEPIMFLTPTSGTGTVTKIASNVETQSWGSGASAVGAATGVAVDDQYVYWGNGQRVYRQLITATSGATSAVFVDITGWNNAGTGAGTDGGGQRSIQYLAVDSTHIYIVAKRGYDGMAVLRANKSTGLQDTTWTWGPDGGREAGGISVDPAPTGKVFLQWGNSIGFASKTATAGAPTTSNFGWWGSGVQNNSSGAEPVPIVNDGTYLYWRTGWEGVNRRAMSLGAGGGAGMDAPALQGLPSGVIRGLAINKDTGVVYASSTTGSSNSYKIFSGIPNESTPGAFAEYATFTSSSGNGLNGLVVIAAPASAPTISTQPTGSAKTVGENTVFTVVATSLDGGTLSYQWKKDGTSVSGATSASLTINSVSLTDAGSYTVDVTNTLGSSSASVTSTSASLTVSLPVATTTTVAPAPVVTAAPAAPAVTVAPVVTTASTVPVVSNAATPSLVTSANQAALTASPGKASVLVNGVAVTPQIVTASNSAAAQADPAERTPEQVRELQQAAATIETRLDTIAGGDSGVSVVRTGTGAVMTGIFSGTRVPVEDVVVVNAADTATLFAARDVRGNIVEVKPGAVLEVASNGDVAVQAFGLRPGETVELVVMSTPTLLGRFTVDAKGAIKTSTKLPTSIGSGNHSLVVASPSVKASLGLKLVKSAATLPVTGSNTNNASNWAVAVLLSGMYLVLVSRSRRRVL
jgi:hypothetical protein